MYGEIDKKFNLIKKIGEGGTSKVYLANFASDQQSLCAIKVIKQCASNDIKLFKNEITSLQQVQHPNVVKLYDGGEGVLSKETGKKEMVQYLVIELVKYGEIFDYIFFPQKGFGENIGRYLFAQLLNGLEACHKSGIVHRDMKTENIMLALNWEIKIADFGFATKADGKKGNGLLYTSLGTASYASPEVLSKKPYLGVQADIFSLGVCLFVLVTGKMPFKHAMPDDAYYREIIKMNYNKYWEKISSKIPLVSNEFKQLFVMLINFDPCSRPTIEEAREHSWIKGFTPDIKEVEKEFNERNAIINMKKELERKKEDDMQKSLENKQFIVYKGDSSTTEPESSLIITDTEFIVRELENERGFENPYLIIFSNEDKPLDLFKHIIDCLLKDADLLITKHEGKCKLSISCYPKPSTSDDDLELYNNFITDYSELLIEVKKQGDRLVVDFTRQAGSKYDFHKLFCKIKQIL